MGKIFKFLFIVFNIFMAIWLFGVLAVLSESIQPFEQIGSGIGVMMILMIWAIGSVILGFLALVTRAKK